MKTVKDLLSGKGGDVWRISPDAMVYDALKLMAEKNVGALVVANQGDVVGIISERDYARKTILKGRTSTDTPVRDIMTSDVVFVRPDHMVEECMALMTEKRIRHLPVVEEGELAGMISIGDIVKAIISEQEFVIGQLEGYIQGKW